MRNKDNFVNGKCARFDMDIYMDISVISLIYVGNMPLFKAKTSKRYP